MERKTVDLKPGDKVVMDEHLIDVVDRIEVNREPRACLVLVYVKRGKQHTYWIAGTESVQTVQE